MPKKVQNYATTIFGAIVTIILSLISDFILELPTEITWLTFFIGTMVTVSSTLLEHKIQDSVPEDIKRKLEIQQIFDQSDYWLQERINSLVIAWGETSKLPSLFSHIARKRMQELHNQIVEIADGETVVEETDYRLLEALIKDARKTIKATSMVSLDWWNSPVGKKYREMNVEAVKQKVEVTRIFIYSQISDDLISFMEEMEKDGINVFFVNKDHIPADISTDFVVSDNHLVLTLQFGPDDSIIGHHFSARPVQVEEKLGYFSQLMWHTEKLEEIKERKLKCT